MKKFYLVLFAGGIAIIIFAGLILDGETITIAVVIRMITTALLMLWAGGKIKQAKHHNSEQDNGR